MTEGEAMAAMLTGPRSHRLEGSVTLELDCAIKVMTGRLGGGHQRSEAARRLLARGVAADPDLTALALDMAARIRSAHGE